MALNEAVITISKSATFAAPPQNPLETILLHLLNLPTPQRPTLNPVTPNRQLLRQLRPIVIKIKRCQKGLGIHHPTAELAQITDQFLAGTLFLIAVSHQAGAGGGLVGLATGKALPGQSLIQGGPNRLGQGDQSDANALGWQGLPSHQLACWRQPLHGHGGGLG